MGSRRINFQKGIINDVVGEYSEVVMDKTG
jgi:hypothetical protein